MRMLIVLAAIVFLGTASPAYAKGGAAGASGHGHGTSTSHGHASGAHSGKHTGRPPLTVHTRKSAPKSGPKAH